MHKKSFELADVLRTGFSQYCAQYGPFPKEYYTVANAIMACHTAALGGHVLRCEKCGHDLITYNSCRNRHCPSCQAFARAQWVEKRIEELLDVPYFHVVFTIPSELNPFALRNKKAFHSLLFKAVSQTLIELGMDPKRLGAQLGFIAVLHTWGQNLLDHPHLHIIVPGGGLDDDRWVPCTSRKFFLPVKVLASLFRGKFMHLFKTAIETRQIGFHGDLSCYEHNYSLFKALLDKLYTTDWVVYAKPPFGGPKAVVKYLGRYTHRIAISNSRIVSMSDTHVSFTWKDYADNNANKVMTLSITEFIRRFFLHIVPRGFVRIRYYGFLGARCRKTKLQLCKDQTNTPAQCDTTLYHNLEDAADVPDQSEQKYTSWKCPHCGKTCMKHYKLIHKPDPGGTLAQAA